MTDKNGSQSTGGTGERRNSKDISEILRMLRDSVGKPIEDRPSEKLDGDLEEQLREKLDGSPAATADAPKTELPDEEIDESTDEEDAIDPEEIFEEEIDEILDADEEAADDDDDAPWYSDDDQEADDESEDDEPLGAEDVADAVDDDAPWYSDEEADEDDYEELEESEDDEDELTAEEILGGFADDDDGDSKWYIDDNDADDENGELPEEEPIGEEIPEEEPVEEEIPEEEPVEEEIPEEERKGASAFDDADISLLESMGYDAVTDEDGNDEIVPIPRETDDDDGDSTYGNDGVEYETDGQNDDIASGYKRIRNKPLIRLAVTGGVSLLLMIYEVLFFSGAELPWIFNQYDQPLAHIMVSLQLLVIAIAFAAKPLLQGVKDIFKGAATPYSLSAVTATASLIYTVIIAIVRPDDFMLFNFSGAFAIFLACLHEVLLIRHEARSFAVISDSRSKGRFALENDDCSGEVLGAPVRALRAYRTKFNKDYFARTAKRPDDIKGIGLMIAIVSGAATVVFALTSLIWGVADGLKAGIVMINFALPLCSLLTYSFPIMLASHKFMGNNGVILGHSVADEYSEVGFLTFDEADLFPSIKTSRVEFKPTGDMPISEIMRMTGLMFSKIGGPISRLVRLDEEKYLSGEAEIKGIFDDGISATVDGCEMLAGSARFLELYGVSVGLSADEKDDERSLGVLYVAIDGRLSARYCISYRPDRDFVKMVNMLGAMGVAVGVRTHNPAVNSDVISARCREMKYKVYAIKLGSGEKDDLTSAREQTHSGICSIGKAARLARPFVAARILKRVYRADRVIRVVAASLGGAFVAIMALLGQVWQFNSLQAAIYQLVFSLPAVITAIVALCRRR